MVQGVPAIDWKKPENNAKLFAAVLALIPGTPDCKKIAKAFGPNVPANAISYRLGVVRKEGIASGFSSDANSTSASPMTKGATTPAKRPAPVAKTNGVKMNGRKGGKMLSKDSSDDDPDTAMDSKEEESAPETDNDEMTPTTPNPSKRQKVIGGRVTKRLSPRKNAKKDYKTIGDPFSTMEAAKDENGNNVFGPPSRTESEDTYATDGSFKTNDEERVVKVKEEAM